MRRELTRWHSKETTMTAQEMKMTVKALAAPGQYTVALEQGRSPETSKLFSRNRGFRN